MSDEPRDAIVPDEEPLVDVSADAAPVAAAEVASAEVPRPRRSARHRKAAAEEETESEPGYRATRRSGKAGKKARQAERSGRIQTAIATSVARLGRGLAVALGGIVALAVVLGAVYLGIIGVNALARWNAARDARTGAAAPDQQKSRENLLVIGTLEKQATGFLALRVDGKTQRAFGLAIPDGAFMEVPGQGFERIGDSYKAGPKVSLDTVSNYLGVRFDYYVVVDDATYKAMVKDQDVATLAATVTDTNLSKAELSALDATLKKVPGKNVGLAPLPVRPINIGSSTYYEPQRDQIADLLYSWWGVKTNATSEMPRVILYNGAGEPGIAGLAARQLIKARFRVVDTGNADRFDYAKTQIVLLQGEPGVAARVRDILGVGEVVSKTASQDITDVVVIIGKDYKPPAD